jgi:hypothetical protein
MVLSRCPVDGGFDLFAIAIIGEVGRRRADDRLEPVFDIVCQGEVVRVRCYRRPSIKPWRDAQFIVDIQKCDRHQMERQAAH